MSNGAKRIYEKDLIKIYNDTGEQLEYEEIHYWTDSLVSLKSEDCFFENYNKVDENTVAIFSHHCDWCIYTAQLIHWDDYKIVFTNDNEEYTTILNVANGWLFETQRKEYKELDDITFKKFLIEHRAVYYDHLSVLGYTKEGIAIEYFEESELCSDDSLEGFEFIFENGDAEVIKSLRKLEAMYENQI